MQWVPPHQARWRITRSTMMMRRSMKRYVNVHVLALSLHARTSHFSLLSLVFSLCLSLSLLVVVGARFCVGLQSVSVHEAWDQCSRVGRVGRRFGCHCCWAPALCRADAGGPLAGAPASADETVPCSGLDGRPIAPAWLSRGMRRNFERSRSLLPSPTVN